MNYYGFEYASEKLKSDKNFILNAINSHPCVLNYVSEELKNDSKFMKDAIMKNYYAYQYASTDLKDNDEVILCLLNSMKNFAYKKLYHNIILLNFYNNNCVKKQFNEEIQNQIDKILKEIIDMNDS